MKYKAACDEESTVLGIRSSLAYDLFAGACAIIAGFRLGSDTPEVAAMLLQLRLDHGASDPPSEQANPGATSEPMKRTRMTIDVESYCKISVNSSGDLVVPLVTQTTGTTELEGDMSNESIRLSDPNRFIAAGASKKTRAGDILLFINTGTGKRAPRLGLIVRHLIGRLCSIIGQFIFDPMTEVCPSHT